MLEYKKMILTHLFMQRLQYFRAQIPHALLGGEKGKKIRSFSSQSECAFYAKIVQLFSRHEAH